MKTKFKIGGGVLFILLIASLVRTEYQEKSNNVLLLNIEALANGETNTGRCFWSGSLDCPDTGAKVYKVF